MRKETVLVYSPDYLRRMNFQPARQISDGVVVATSRKSNAADGNIESSSVLNGKNGIVIINKWQTTLGQTIYTKTFQPKNVSIQSHQSKETVSTSQQVMTKESKKFVLNFMDISELLGNPQFKTNITIGKVLKIIEDLITDKETIKNLSKKYKVDQLFVEQIGKYVTDMKGHNLL